MAFDRSSAQPDRYVTVNEALDLTMGEEDLEASPSQADTEEEPDSGTQDDMYEASGSEDGGVQATEELGGLESEDISPTARSDKSSTGHINGLNLEQIQDPDERECDRSAESERVAHDEAEGLARSPSPVPTDVIPEAPKRVIPFEKVIEPGIIARDYAFHPQPLRPAPMVFSILSTYIWFHYNRWRATKQMPRILINAWQSAFIGCDIVYLIHFNWVSMKEISWLDAQDWLGEGLLYLYKNPRDVEIPNGAKRPSPRSAFVRQWFARFNECKTLEFNSLTKECPKRQKEYARGRFEFHGPFGEAMHHYFPHEETAVFWPLYDYLLGKGPKPQLSETMEKIFEPILRCYDGSVGGRGKPCERPRDKNVVEPLQGTEPEHVDVDPDWLVMERTKVPAFTIYRREEAKKRERELIRQVRELEEKITEEEDDTKATKKRKKGKSKHWTRRKKHKSHEKKGKKTDTGEEEEMTNTEADRRITRSMAKTVQNASKSPDESVKAQKSKGGKKMKGKATDALDTRAEAPTIDKKGKGSAKHPDLPTEQPGTDQEEPISLRRREKGKGKVRALPTSEAKVGSKRRREDDEIDSNHVEIAPSEPGPSSRQIRRVRLRVQAPEENGPSNSPKRGGSDSDSDTRKLSTSSTRGTKRQRDSEADPGQSEGDGEARTPKRIRLLESDVTSNEMEGVTTGDATTSEVADTANSGHATPLQHPPQEPTPAVHVPQPVQPQVNDGQPPLAEPAQNAQLHQPHLPKPLRRCDTILFHGQLLRPDW